MRILFILSTLLLLFPAFGWLLNGLSYATNRWIWAYSLLVAYIVTTQWKKLRHITVGQAVACVGALALYSLLAIPLMTTDTRNIGVSVLLAFLIIVLCALAPKFKKKHLATALVLVLVLTSFTGNAAYFYSSHGADYASKFVTYDQASKKLKNTDAKKVKKATKKTTAFTATPAAIWSTIQICWLKPIPPLSIGACKIRISPNLSTKQSYPLVRTICTRI